MTLYRELLLYTVSLLTVLFIAVWLTNVQTTRKFLEEQLESHAQDTATSLSLSITSKLAENDLATVATMVNVVFDRGYYKSITIVDLSGDVILDRVNTVSFATIPQWFIRLVPLNTPKARSPISSGWMKKGFLYVESHPGYAYRALWRSTLTISIVFSTVALGVLIIGAIGLRLVLAPLNRVEQQAEDLCRKVYTFQRHLPRTRELRRVVSAMNIMTEKVKKMFEEQAEIAENFRKAGYLDAVTGLGNRRFLANQIEVSMESQDTPRQGAFLLLEMQNMQKLNQARGYSYTDGLLRGLALAIADSVNADEDLAARLGGGTFAIRLNSADYSYTLSVAEEILAKIDNLFTRENLLKDCTVFIGGIVFYQSALLSDLLVDADQSIRSLTLGSDKRIAIRDLAEDKPGQAAGKMQWNKLLAEALEKDSFVLYRQAILAPRDRNLLHHEILLRLLDNDGQEIHAAEFIPAAVQCGLGEAIDILVIEKVLQSFTVSQEPLPLAVNISAISLQSDSFFSFIRRLPRAENNSPVLIFEFSEFTATANLSRLLELAAILKPLGHRIGLDKFGKGAVNFGYLKSLQPQYVKIDRAFIHPLGDTSSDSHFFVSSLASVAHSLDIEVYGEGIEREEQFAASKSLNLDGVQGYYLDYPKRLIKS